MEGFSTLLAGGGCMAYIIIICFLIYALISSGIESVRNDFHGCKIMAVLLFISALIQLIGGYILVGYNSNAQGIIIMGWIVILFPFFWFISIITRQKKYKKQAQKAAEAALAEKNKKLSIDIFAKCFEKGVYALNSDEDVSGLMIISGMYGITDIEQAKAMFTKGQLLSQKQKAAENKKILKSARENEAKNHKEEKEKAKISAKEKYLWGTKAIQAACALTGALSTSGMAGASEAMRYRAQKSDSAILGGIANGLAGPGAGIATAINTEIENARAEAEAAEVRANAREAYKHHQEALRDTQRKQYTVDERIKFIEGLVCDEQNINQKFQMLTISEPTYKINTPQNSSPVPKSIEVAFSIESVQPVVLFKEKAILDGSLKVIVKNSSGNIIGEGFYCAPGFDKSRLISGGTSKVKYEIMPITKAGFESVINQSINVNCYIFDSYYEQLSADDELEIEIKPVKMWVIEGKLIG